MTESFTIQTAPEMNYSPTLFVSTGTCFKKVAVTDIIYLKAAKDYTLIYTEAEKYLSSWGIGYLEDKLNPQLFKRVHRSFIVNLGHVNELHREFGKTYLVMKGGVELNVGRCYGESLKQLLI